MKICDALATNSANNRQLEERVDWAGVRTISRHLVAKTGLVTFARWHQQPWLLTPRKRIADSVPVATITLDLGTTLQRVHRYVPAYIGDDAEKVCGGGAAQRGIDASIRGLEAAQRKAGRRADNRRPPPCRQYVPSPFLTASPPFPLNCSANRSALLASNVVSTPTATNSAPASR